MSAAPPSEGPLSGLVVADFSRVLASPYATMLLGDRGAEVIKVEGSGGDDTRGRVPPVRGDVGTYYLAVNRNNRSIVLDLKDPEDLAAAQELSARADIMSHNVILAAWPASAWTTTRSARATRPSSTAGSAAPAQPAAPSCPATTCSCRACPG